MELVLREIMNAIFYVVRIGCQWKNLPRDYPNYKSVYYHYRKWCLDGTWERINRTLVYLERKRQARLPHPSVAIIDSQSSKTTESGGEHSYDGGKKLTDLNVTFWSTPWVTCCWLWFMRLASLTVWGLNRSLNDCP